MAIWQSTLTTIVRTLINDLDETEYTDDQIQKTLVIAGLQVDNSITLSQTYIFDFEDYDISPDPVVNATFDSLAIALFTLKAACILNMNRYQKAIKNGTGVKLIDDDISVDTTVNFRGYKDILELGPCKSYEKLLEEQKIKKSMKVGKAVMTPIAHEDFCRNLTSVSRFFDGFGDF